MPEQTKPVPEIEIENAPPPYNEFLDARAPESEYHYFVDGEGRPCADRLPFRPDAQGFDLLNAWWLCEAATLVYSDLAVVKSVFEQKTQLKDVTPFATGGGTECFVAANKEVAIVAFRGSELTPRESDRHNYSNIVKDWVRNATIRMDDFDGGGRVHHGFDDGIRQLNDEGFDDFIAGLSSRKVWFTGHSLGAALATAAAARALAHGRRLDGLYTFGSPRVGDETYAGNLQQRMADRGLTCYRFANGNDVVTTVPLLSTPPVVNFKHAGTLKHIDGKGRITDDPSHFEQLKAKVVDLFDQLGGHFLNGIPNGIEDHVPTLYSTHIWNAYADEQNGRG